LASGSQQEETKQSNAQASYIDPMETLDETILIKNSFCIINAAYMRKHSVSPKNFNSHEYKILL
jgi:hypothetical protein